MIISFYVKFIRDRIKALQLRPLAATAAQRVNQKSAKIYYLKCQSQCRNRRAAIEKRAWIGRRNRKGRNRQKVKIFFYCAFFIFLLRPPQQLAEGAAEVVPKQAPKQLFLRRNRKAFIRPEFIIEAIKKVSTSRGGLDRQRASNSRRRPLIYRSVDRIPTWEKDIYVTSFFNISYCINFD